jgi:hypothetical protein
MLHSPSDSIETRASWVVASVALFAMLMSFGAAWITAVALKDIAAEVGGARAIPSFASALAWLGSGIGGIIMGQIADRVGTRWTVMFGALMVALGLSISTFGPPWPLWIANRRVLVRVPVQVSYSSNVDIAMKLMLEAAHTHSRVLKDPPPMAVLAAFGDNGVNLELLVWIEDPERGKLNLNSDLNLALYNSFRENNVEIPFARRDIRIVGGAALLDRGQK